MAATKTKKGNPFSGSIRTSIEAEHVVSNEISVESPKPITEANDLPLVSEKAPIEVSSKRTKHKDKAVSLKVNGETWTRFKKYAELNGSTANGMLTQLIAGYVFKQEKKFGS